jgi:hypothetical protein
MDIIHLGFVRLQRGGLESELKGQVMPSDAKCAKCAK